MKKALLIAEKPDYMRLIKKVYEKHKRDLPMEIEFTAQHGHLLQLLEPSELNEKYKKWDIDDLPIEPEQEGGWKYKVIPGSEHTLKNIDSLLHSGKYDAVIHAGDPDQEGELLVRLVLEHLNNNLPVLRLWVNAQTEAEVLVGLKNMKSDNDDYYENLYHAALVRQHSDWRFGMNGSRAAAGKINTSKENKIAVGRVMTTIQAVIVKREEEIRNFKPETTYGVKVQFENGMEGQYFSTDDSGQSGFYFENREDAEKLIQNLTDVGTVIDVQKEREAVYAPKLFSLADIQYEASKLGYSPIETLGVIQGLYEKHILTYPRTDCNYLSSTDEFEAKINAAASVPGYERVAEIAIMHIEEVKKNKRFVNDKELQKHGHSALCPTDIRPDFETLTSDERNIYKLVCKRYLAVFLPPLLQDKTIVVTENNGNLFKSTGKTVVNKGYTEFVRTEMQDVHLPAVQKGEKLAIGNKSVVERTTTCPKRFTEGSIIRALDHPAKFLQDKNISNKSFCIGTAATRGAILQKLIDDSFIQKTNKGIIPTEWGKFFIHVLKDVDVTKADMTANWENMLLDLKEGKVTVEAAEEVMRHETRKMIDTIGKIDNCTFGKAGAARRIIGNCPYCGNEIIAGENNYFCSGFRSGCNISIPRKLLGASFSMEDAMTLIKGGTCRKKLKKERNSWIQDLQFNKDEGKLVFARQEVLTNISCPVCNERLKKDGNKVKCICGYSLWTVVAKRELNENEIRYILHNGYSDGKLSGFISSKGKKFSAQLLLKSDKAGFEFKF